MDQRLEILDRRGIRKGPHSSLIIEKCQHSVLSVGSIFESKHGALAVSPYARKSVSGTPEIACQVEIRRFENVFRTRLCPLQHLPYPVWL